MAEKLASPEKSGFKKSHGKWLEKATGGISNVFAGINAAVAGTFILTGLGIASPFLLFTGAASAVAAGVIDARNARKSGKK